MAVRQLDLFHPEHGQDNICLKLQCCQGVKETLEQSVGQARVGNPAGKKLICHCIGERRELGRLQNFLVNCANRRTPRLSTVVQAQLERYHSDEMTAYAAVWTHIWHILSSVCITRLWQPSDVPARERNSVHEF